MSGNIDFKLFIKKKQQHTDGSETNLDCPQHPHLFLPKRFRQRNLLQEGELRMSLPKDGQQRGFRQPARCHLCPLVSELPAENWPACSSSATYILPILTSEMLRPCCLLFSFVPKCLLHPALPHWNFHGVILPM